MNLAINFKPIETMERTRMIKQCLDKEFDAYEYTFSYNQTVAGLVTKTLYLHDVPTAVADQCVLKLKQLPLQLRVKTLHRDKKIYVWENELTIHHVSIS